jgi:3-methyladenine DNA glycosylase/8-oxoguanine DNA glycosylase
VEDRVQHPVRERLRAIADRWRPWRAYGVMHVWNRLASTKNRRATCLKSK